MVHSKIIFHLLQHGDRFMSITYICIRLSLSCSPISLDACAHPHTPKKCSYVYVIHVYVCIHTVCIYVYIHIHTCMHAYIHTIRTHVYTSRVSVTYIHTALITNIFTHSFSRTCLGGLSREGCRCVLQHAFARGECSGCGAGVS